MCTYLDSSNEGSVRLHLILLATLHSILCYALESFFYINAFLGRGLEVWDIPFRCTPSTSFFLRNLEWLTKDYMDAKRTIHTYKVHLITKYMDMHAHTNLSERMEMEREYACPCTGRKGFENIKFKQVRTTLLFPPSTSILFPMTTNGKFSGSDGLACRFLTSSAIIKIDKS